MPPQRENCIIMDLKITAWIVTRICSPKSYVSFMSQGLIPQFKIRILVTKYTATEH